MEEKKSKAIKIVSGAGIAILSGLAVTHLVKAKNITPTTPEQPEEPKQPTQPETNLEKIYDTDPQTALLLQSAGQQYGIDVNSIIDNLVNNGLSLSQAASLTLKGLELEGARRAVSERQQEVIASGGNYNVDPEYIKLKTQLDLKQIQYAIAEATATGQTIPPIWYEELTAAQHYADLANSNQLAISEYSGEYVSPEEYAAEKAFINSGEGGYSTGTGFYKPVIVYNADGSSYYAMAPYDPLTGVLSPPPGLPSSSTYTEPPPPVQNPVTIYIQRPDDATMSGPYIVQPGADGTVDVQGFVETYFPPGTTWIETSSGGGGSSGSTYSGGTFYNWLQEWFRRLFK